METELKGASALGGVGYILILVAGIAAIPLGMAGTLISSAITIIGLTLALVALKKVSDVVKDPLIFKNYLISFVIIIIGIIIGAIAWTLYMPLLLDPMAWLDLGALIGMLTIVFAILAVSWVTMTISAVFLRRSFNSVADRLNAKLFRTAALVYLIGAALIIILIGALVVFVAEILIVIAFFTMPTKLPAKPA